MYVISIHTVTEEQHEGPHERKNIKQEYFKKVEIKYALNILT